MPEDATELAWFLCRATQAPARHQCRVRTTIFAKIESLGAAALMLLAMRFAGRPVPGIADAHRPASNFQEGPARGGRQYPKDSSRHGEVYSCSCSCLMITVFST